jgi:hypothetical protein
MLSSSKVSGSFCLCALVGVIIRWVIMGKRAGFSLMSAVNNGVTSTFLLVLVVIFIQCANEMSRLFMRGNYEGLVEALSEIIPIGIDFVVKASSTVLWSTALIGGIDVGMTIEAIWHRVH